MTATNTNKVVLILLSEMAVTPQNKRPYWSKKVQNQTNRTYAKSDVRQPKGLTRFDVTMLTVKWYGNHVFVTLYPLHLSLRAYKTIATLSVKLLD